MTMFKKILVPLDGSLMAERILPAAAEFAKRHDGKLVLFHAIERHPIGSIHGERHLTKPSEAESYLHEVSRRYSGVESEQHVHVLPAERVPHSIAFHGIEFGCDTIAMTTHGRGGFSRLLLGSVALRTLAEARLPLLLAPAKMPARNTFDCATVVAPFDGADAHEAGVLVAADVARSFEAKLRLVSVIKDSSGSRGGAARLMPATAHALAEIEAEELGKRLASLAARLGASGMLVETDVLYGSGPEVLLASRHAADADLFVCASHPRRGLEAFGSSSFASALTIDASTHILFLPA